MTQEQNELLFELTCRKLEAELAAAEVEARLKWELMVKEFEARVAAEVAAASTTAGTQARMSTAEEDDITGEVPPEVTIITLRFAGVLQEEIVRVFQNKFKPINLFRLRHMYGLRFDALQDHDRIDIEDGILRFRKTSGTYKDFGKSFYDVWADAFHNYTTILVSLFSKEAPDLHTILAKFYNNVYELSTVYEWHDAVLPMAIEAHRLSECTAKGKKRSWQLGERSRGSWSS